MPVSSLLTARTEVATTSRVASGRLNRRTFFFVLAISAATILLRLPSFFEPPWHSDEGIFAAVAARVAAGGSLYADAWESKPPLFLYIYAAIGELFGAGVLPLRIVTTAAAIGTQWALFGVALRFMDRKRALAASLIAALLLGVPFWEGTLALTESFAVLPSTLAVLLMLKATDDARPAATLTKPSSGDAWLLTAGVLLGLSLLIRQTSVVGGVAVIAWLLLSGRAWLRPALVTALGGAAVVLPAIGAFAVFGSFHWFWDANVGFFFQYVPSGEQLPLHYRPLILTPVLLTAAVLLWYRRQGETPRWGLAALWLALALAAALLTGRPYSHYFLLVFPPLALVVAMVAPSLRLGSRPRAAMAPAAVLVASFVVLWAGVVVPEFQGNVLAMRYTKVEGYYPNFAAHVLGLKSDAAYDDYFDKRIALTERLAKELERRGAAGKEVYIWGEYPWVYPLSGGHPATRYVTSFYVLLIPYLDTQLFDTLTRADPRFIVMLADAWPRIEDDTKILNRRYLNATVALNRLIAWRYEEVAVVGRARIFQRTAERTFVDGVQVREIPPR